MYLNENKTPDTSNRSTYIVDKGKHQYEFNVLDSNNDSSAQLAKQIVNVLVSSILSSNDFKCT